MFFLRLKVHFLAEIMVRVPKIPGFWAAAIQRKAFKGASTKVRKHLCILALGLSAPVFNLDVEDLQRQSRGEAAEAVTCGRLDLEMMREQKEKQD